MSSCIFGSSSAPNSRASAAAAGPVVCYDHGMSLEALPDELISMCYSSLPARDLVALELVSRRLRELVCGDETAWKACAELAWGQTHNLDLMNLAVASAGTWKALYASKKAVDVSHAPWNVPCSHEVRAIMELVKGDAPPCSSKNKPESLLGAASGSPCSILATSSGGGSLSIVLLIDGSSSVTEDDFHSMKQFCLELISSLRQTHADAQVAVLQFNQYPKVHAGLTSVEKQSLVTTIHSLDQMMGSTDIAAPIRRARQVLTEEGAGLGEKAIVILTDGQTHSDELREAEREARKAALDSGARLFALGVGRDVDESGLRRVARGTSEALPVCARSSMSTGHYFPLRKMNR